MKTKKRFICLFALFLIAVAGLFIGLIHGETQTASAATTPKYNMTFNYSGQYENSSVGANKTGTYSGSTTLLTVGSSSYFDSFTFGLYIYGSGYSGTGTLSYGGTIVSDTVNIIANTETLYKYTGNYSLITSVQLYNSSGVYTVNSATGSDSDTLSTTLYSGTLADDQYTLVVVWKTKSRPNTYAYEFTEITATASFKVQSDPCADGHSYKSAVTSPTCTSTGYTTYTCTVCGYSYTGNTTSALGHSYTAKTVDATCTSGSYTVYTCTRCGDSYTSGTTTSALGHSYSATTTSATCTSGGYTTYTCTRCGYSYTGNSTPAAGHSYTAAVTSPTCTSTGYTTYTCTKCGYSYTGSTTAALGHSYTATTASSTCTDEGYTTYKCTRCGISYTDSPTQATGHSYVADITEPTCTERGYTVFTCTKCGDSYTGNETEALGHNYISETVASGCTESGYTLYTCSRCGYSYTGGNIQPTGHSYVTTTVAATCSEGGYSLHTCSTCGESYKDNLTQPLGHNYKSEYQAATCTESGGTVYTCQVCGYEYRDGDGTYPTGHNYTVTVVTSPTCTTEGLLRSICDDCGDSHDTVVAANGHNYTITSVTSDGGITTRTYTCTECGECYTQELGDQYEEVANYVEYLFDAYSPYMWWVLLAAAGIWSIVIGVMIAIARKNEDKEKARKMLVNYVIGLVVIAVILVACPYLIRGIAALIT